MVNELADISLGDAWLEPYSKDGRGTSVVVTRNLLAEKIIQNSIKNVETAHIKHMGYKRIIERLYACITRRK